MVSNMSTWTDLYKLLPFALLGMSFVGHFLFLAKKTNIPPATIPGVIASTIVVVEYLAGLLNVLELSTYMVFVFGLLLFIKEAGGWIHKKKTSNSCDLKLLDHDRLIQMKMVLIIMITVATYSLVNYYQAALTTYDDFSHWGTMIKCILVNNRYPRATDTCITFQSYPPGSANFIYYCCRITGNREWSYLLFQYLHKTAYLMALFVFCESNREKKALYTSIAFITIMLMSIHNVSSYWLCVDALLACNAFFCYVVVTIISNQQIESPKWVICIALTSCVLIKNSGLFFYMMMVILYLAIEKHQDKRTQKQTAIVLAIPALAFFLWKRHVEYAFVDGMQSKHSVSVRYYVDVVSQKSFSDIMEEIEIIGRCIISATSNKSFLIAVSFMLVYIVLTVSKIRNSERTICAWAIISIIMYQIGLMMMYVFSMPHGEVVFQNGHDYLRYNGTMVTFMTGVFISVSLALLKDINDDSKAVYHRKAVMGAVLTTAMLCTIINMVPDLNWEDFRWRTKMDPNNESYYRVRTELQKGIESTSLNSEDRLIVLIDEQSIDPGYVNYMMKYILLKSEGYQIETEGNDSLSEKIEESGATCYIDCINHTAARVQ